MIKWNDHSPSEPSEDQASFDRQVVEWFAVEAAAEMVEVAAVDQAAVAALDIVALFVDREAVLLFDVVAFEWVVFEDNMIAEAAVEV